MTLIIILVARKPIALAPPGPDFNFLGDLGKSINYTIQENEWVSPLFFLALL